jgi:tripartite-type tricarboxylate transporter receptor subunit TctC
MYRAGKLRLLAFTAPKRSADFPDIPTVGESGGPKDFEVTGWNVVAVPPGLSAATTDKIRKDLAEVLKDKDFAEKFKTFGYEPFPTTPEQFQATVKSEAQRFGDVIRKANISLD